MKFLATFSLNIAGPSGIHINYEDEYKSFDWKVDNNKVTITPIYSKFISKYMVAEEKGEFKEERYKSGKLESLQLIIEYESKKSKLTPEIHDYLNEIATKVFRYILVQLRENTFDHRIDINLTSLVFTEYRSKNGKYIEKIAPGIIGMLGKTQHSFIGSVLNSETWTGLKPFTSLSRASSLSKRLDKEWLLFALSFYEAQDYTMSLVSAALSCEIALQSIYLDKLKSTGFKEDSIKDMIGLLSKRTLVKYLCDIGIKQEIVTDSQSIFETRNNVIHGKQRAFITEKESLRALACANFFVKYVNEITL